MCISRVYLLTWLLVACCLSGRSETLATPHQFLGLWYAQPAQKWTEALPVGNGRLGAMIFGGVDAERIQFNEDTLWKGHPHDYVRAGAREHLDEIRRLLFQGDAKTAGEIVRSTFLSDPVRQKAYQPFGDLHLTDHRTGEISDYRRELDLATACVKTSYRRAGIRFTRTVFASYPDQSIVVRLTADHPQSIAFTLKMDSPQTISQTKALSSDTLALTGLVEDGGEHFEARVHAVCEGGQCVTNGSALEIKDADAVTLILVAATSFKNFEDISADPAQRCAAAWQPVSGKKYEQLLAAHLADYQNLFHRVTLDLGSADQDAKPTDQRVQAMKAAGGLDADPAFAALYFQYGRYLLIASSRPGGQPANLQGVWNQELNPPWESKWTLNINCEMNYWPAELCNLSECAAPLFAMINDLTISGARAAKEQYGCRGWVVHHNTDLWRGAAPINNIDGVWPTGGAWLCYHLWEHYLFTGDQKFLAGIYPALKQASLFFMDYLVKDPKTGWLVTSPSFSPEQGTLCYGPTMDNQLIRALMDSTIAAAGILATDRSFAADLAKVRDQLPPNQIGRYGQLQEWLADVDQPNNNHRHMSPLWALYPGADISPANSNLWAAAKLLLKWRGGGSTGWSYAWRIPLWARVGDGAFAYQQLAGLFRQRTLPNLFDLCGPFQIDGNFGATAGIVEMLLQSQWSEHREGKELRLISVLPALPAQWPIGSVKGLCARDGFVVDLNWEKGSLTRVTLHSKLGRSCLLRYGNHEAVVSTAAGRDYVFDGNLQPIHN